MYLLAVVSDGILVIGAHTFEWPSSFISPEYIFRAGLAGFFGLSEQLMIHENLHQSPLAQFNQNQK